MTVYFTGLYDWFHSEGSIFQQEKQNKRILLLYSTGRIRSVFIVIGTRVLRIEFCDARLQKYIYRVSQEECDIYIYTGCPRRNVPDFGRVLLMLKYTDITQNTYVQS